MHSAIRAPGRDLPLIRKMARGPLTHSPSHAPGCNVGLGRESRVPPGPQLGPLDVSRPYASNGHAWIPTEQKRRWRPRANPRVHLRFLAPRSAAPPATAPPWAVSSARVPTDRWTRRRRAAPRQSHTRASSRSRRRHSSVDERHGGGWHRHGPSHRRARPPMGGRAAI
jgi:hypothetical protein